MQALKKLTALLLVLSMIFALAACSGAGGKNNIFDTKGTEAAQKTETEPTPEETKKASFGLPKRRKSSVPRQSGCARIATRYP